MQKTLVLLAALLITLSGCTTKSLIKDIEPEEMQQLMDQKIVLVDVRTPAEFQNEYIPGAVNIDWNSDTFESEILDFDKTSPIIIYCRSGQRSYSAANKMKQLGFTEIYALTGGINAWSDAGKPVQK